MLTCSNEQKIHVTLLRSAAGLERDTGVQLGWRIVAILACMRAGALLASMSFEENTLVILLCSPENSKGHQG